MHGNVDTIKKFFHLLNAGKQAALDVHQSTGEVVCMRSYNDHTDAEGNGTPPQTYTASWQRLAACDKGRLITVD